MQAAHAQPGAATPEPSPVVSPTPPDAPPVTPEQPSGTPGSAAPAAPSAGGMVVAPGPVAPAPGGRSPSVGVGLAIAGTLVPVIGFGVGLGIDDEDVSSRVVIISAVGGLVLPSLGLIYAGQKRSLGQYPRVAALGALVMGALLDGLGNSNEAGTWYGITGALYGLGSAIDIAMTPSAVRAYNARRAARPLAVMPMVVRGGGGLVVGGTL